MPDPPASDPQFWRNLAGKARADADQTIDYPTKQHLLRIAESHERVAELVERRLRDAEKSKQGWERTAGIGGMQPPNPRACWAKRSSGGNA
jgi:hypothetical protein